MLMDANQFADDKGVAAIDKVKVLVSTATSITYQMTVLDQVVLVTTITSYGMTVTLPPVSAAKGRIYTIRFITDGTEDLIVDDKNGDADFTALTFADAGDYLVMYSDGYKWFTLINNGGS